MVYIPNPHVYVYEVIINSKLFVKERYFKYKSIILWWKVISFCLYSGGGGDGGEGGGSVA